MECVSDDRSCFIYVITFLKRICLFVLSLLLILITSLTINVDSYADDGLGDIDSEKIGNAFIWGAAQGSIGAAVGTMIAPGTGTVGGAALGAVIGGAVVAVGEAVREIVTPHEMQNGNGN